MRVVNIIHPIIKRNNGNPPCKNAVINEGVIHGIEIVGLNLNVNRLATPQPISPGIKQIRNQCDSFQRFISFRLSFC